MYSCQLMQEVREGTLDLPIARRAEMDFSVFSEDRNT